MRKGCYLLVAFLAAGICQSIAQEIPTHDKYVVLTDETKPGRQKGPNGWEDNPAVQVPLTLENYLPTWQPGTPLSEDENFYISRVPLKKRFVNTKTQVNPALTQDRKFCLWTPMGISDTYWQSLPRYVLAGDNFSMWSYIDSHGGWSLPYIRIPGAYSDVAHKNGVANSGGLIFFDSWGGDNKHAQDVVNMLTTKGGTGGYTYKYSQKLVQFMYYYGIDGIGVNPEGTVPNAADFQDFISECRTYAQSLGREFHVYWYGTSSNAGSMNLGSDFVSSKQNWLYKNNKQVVDMYMLNYSWAGSAASSTSLAERIGANPYTLYAGYDIQGNWLGRGDWNTLKNNKLSIAFWGNHTTNMIYQNSTDMGSGDEAMAYCYLDKQEQVFSGGNQNPANLPAIVAGGVEESSGAAMKNFHGIATYLPARSTLQELPFVTRFGLGNGKFFNYEGVTTFDKKWFNVGVQDYLPTWRWWITDNNGNVPADAINCGFTYEDAWFAGSAMHVTGKTAVSNVRLFKTNFTVNATDKVSLVYKLNSGTESRMKLFWSFVGSENTLHTCDITGGEQGKWVKFSKLATAIGMKGQVALLGIKFENTPADYDVYIGELSIVPSKSFAPVKPTITTNESKILKKRTYNSLEFKFSWNCTPKTAPAQPFIPVYNEDVDTWYFEVYVQASDGKPMLCGTTSSWAHYVVGAPVSTDNNATYRIGVCAVAPDGVTKSDIAWTNYLTIPVTKLDGIKCNKSVIKANEEFTLSLLDPNQDAPISWTITNATTGSTVKTAGRVKEVTMKLSNEGYYDVQLFTRGGRLYYRGFIQISPVETGSLPRIDDFSASKTELDLKTGENSVSLTYTGHKGEGTVSRGLHILDPGMFRIPKEILPLSTKSYSIGLWLKPESLSPAKFGINLLNQRDITVGWPNNNWGRFWVHIWPEFKTAAGTISENCVSYVLFNHGAAEIPEGNRHENPNIACSTDATGRAQHGNSPYKLMIGLWSHIFITYDYSSKTQKIYFNGKEVGSYSQNTKDYYYECPIYVGGSNVYHSGFTGVIDDMQVWNKTLTATEVADAIKGYANRTVPGNLVGYWTFENSTYNTTTKEFTNLGTGNKTAKAAYIEFGGASGEDTSSATESIVAANIGVEGNPALPGTLPIVTTSTFTIANAEVLNSGDQATATFRNNGEYDVTLKLANGWGSDTMTKNEYIVVVGQTSDLDGSVVENMAVYPNPFMGSVNLLFSETGNYEISVYDVQGRQVVNKLHQSVAGEIYILDVNANPGTYYIAISENGKRIKTFKVISK